MTSLMSLKNQSAQDKSVGLMDVAESMPQASASWGIPLAILKSAKKSGCPAFLSGNRIRLATFIRWYFENLAPTNGEEPPEGMANWREALNRVQTKREEIRLAKDRGEVVDFNEARRQASEAAALYFAALERVCREMPPALKGLDEISILKKLEARVEEVRNELNKAFEEVGTHKD